MLTEEESMDFIFGLIDLPLQFVSGSRLLNGTSIPT